MRKQKGFTLLEILLVMLIFASVASMIMLALPDQVQYALKRSMEKLKVQITQVSDKALIDSRTYGLQVSDVGYEFLRLDEQQWAPVGKPIALPEGTNWQVEGDEGFSLMPKTSDDEAESKTPQVYFWADGTMTPFQLVLTTEKFNYRLSVDALGEVDTMMTGE